MGEDEGEKIADGVRSGLSSGAQDVPGAALQLTLPAPLRCLKEQKDIHLRAMEQRGFVILMDLEPAESLFRDMLSRF